MVYKLTHKELSALISRLSGHIDEFGKSETVMQSAEDSRVGFGMEGTVYLYAENDLYERSILGFFGEGECFFADMLDPVTEGVSYFAAKRFARIAYFSRAGIAELCASDTLWGERLLRLFFAQTGKALAHSSILQHKTVRGRLMSYLKRESVLRQSRVITLSVPYADLADYIAADRSTVMREIKKLREEGLLSVEKRVITLNI